MKHFIKLFSIFVSFFLISDFITAQSDFQKRFEAANTLLEQKQYEIAKEIWKDLAKENPNNANVNYKAGLCLLNTTFEKNKALFYLIKAQENISSKYSPIDYTITNAPIETHYYLAQAYHQNYDIDSAIKYFKYFQNKGPKKHFLQDRIPIYLKQCENALALINHPKDYDLINLGKGINSEFADYNPCLTLDENTLFFTSKRTRSEDAEISNKENFNPIDGKHYEDIYVSYRNIQNGEWSSPKLMDFCNPNSPQATIAISGDGEKLFVYLGSSQASEDEIHFTTRDRDFYKLQPLNIFNSNSWENHVTVASDEKTLYFVSDRPGGLGGTDIWRCVQLPNGQWSEPFNIGPPVNSKYNEESPFIHPDGKTLYFSSNSSRSMGGYDVFFSKIKDQQSFSNPINMGYPINTVDDDLFFTTSPDGARGYYASSHDGGYGDNDIYMVNLKDPLSDPVTILKGYIDKGDKEFIPSGIVIMVTDLNEDTEPMQYVPNKNNGSYVFTLIPCHEYDVEYTRTIELENGEYDIDIFYQQSFKVPCESNYKEINKAIVIKGINVEGEVVEIDVDQAKNELVNDQPKVKINELNISEKKLIKLFILDEDGEIISEAILTENGFKFELIESGDKYQFKLENCPENLDISDIMIDIVSKNGKQTIKANFNENNLFNYSNTKFKFKELDLKSKELIKMYLVDDEGKIIGESILTDDGFKFETLSSLNNYKFKIEKYPDNIDMSNIPVEISFNGESFKLNADFSENDIYTYTKDKITFKRTFGYNKYLISEENEFDDFIDLLVSKVKEHKSIELSIIGSASKVPTRIYSSNQVLAQKRVNEAKRVLKEKLKNKNVDLSNVKIIKEKAVVTGPKYNFDRPNKEKYFKYQFFSVTVE
tara:strand:- start:12832 stop:15468 length:2637 start_codon:yes stop_codon:yes gene_type:complete